MLDQGEQVGVVFAHVCETGFEVGGDHKGGPANGNHMGCFFSGLAQAGAWACFDEFNRTQVEVLGVLAQSMLTVTQAIRLRKEEFEFIGKMIPLNRRLRGLHHPEPRLRGLRRTAGQPQGGHEGGHRVPQPAARKPRPRGQGDSHRPGPHHAGSSVQ